MTSTTGERRDKTPLLDVSTETGVPSYMGTQRMYTNGQKRMCKRPVIYVCVCVAKKEQKNQTQDFNYTTRNYSGITLPFRGWDTGKIMAPAAPFIAVDPFEQHNQSYNESATYKEATVNHLSFARLHV